MTLPRNDRKGPILRALTLALACVLALAQPHPAATAQSANRIVIHEVLAANHAGLTDENGNRPDWIELANLGTDPVELTGWSLSDEASKPRKWTFQSGLLAPQGFAIVFASGKDLQYTPTPPTPPNTVPGLALWLRSDSIQLSQPTQVRRVGDEAWVQLWPDLSGRGRHARQEQSQSQPRYIGGPIPAVRFDGLNDLLRIPARTASNSLTLFAVFLPMRGHEIDPISAVSVGGTSGQAWLFGASHGGDSGAGMGLSAGTNGVSLYEHGSSYMPAVQGIDHPASGSWNVVTALYSERRPRLGLSGIATSLGVPSSRNPVTAPVELGSGSYGAFAGDVAEVLVFERALEESEWRSIEAYLMARYQIRPAGTFHTNFRIDAEGERLVLTRPDGIRADEIRTPALPRDVSWGRLRNQPDAWRLFDSPTPGNANSEEGAIAYLRSPKLSIPAGFHTGPVSVALAGSDPGVNIRFTLDGSEPGPESPLYRSPILITNRASLPNRLSAIPTAPGWTAPSGRVFKGTVLRARAFREDALPSDVVTATYFVHPSGVRRYSLPVVSLATDERHFFSAETGIYVVGNAPGGNYSQSGDAWERPVHVEFFETDGIRQLAQESGVRMHGNTSFGFPIKALRLHPLNQRGTGPFRHRIFPDLPIDSFERLLLRPSGHDHNLTMMRDGLMQSIVREIGLDTQGYRPAILFINGEYWGIHNLQEAFEKQYFASHHPEVDADAIDYLEGYAPGAFAYEGDANHYHALVRFLETQSAVNTEAFSWVQEQMEIPNFRDYKLAEIFYYRWDIGNHRLWRPRSEGGRLRWILFDCDVGFGGFWSEPNPWAFDMLRAVLEPSGSLHGHNNPATVFLLQRLLRNASFRSDFINRAADLMNTTLRTERMLGFIDRMAAHIAPEMVEHIQRWRAPSTISEWQRNITFLRTFARERPAHMRQHLIRQFDLAGLSEITLREPAPGAGKVRLNTLDSFAYTNGVWTGVYFRGHPIELEATPAAGYAFEGWEELPGLDRNPLQLRLTGNFTLTPLFRRLNGPRLELVREFGSSIVRLLATGPPRTSVRLETTADLRVWSILESLTTDDQGKSSVVIHPASTRQFYRLRQSTP